MDAHETGQSFSEDEMVTEGVVTKRRLLPGKSPFYSTEAYEEYKVEFWGSDRKRHTSDWIRRFFLEKAAVV